MQLSIGPREVLQMDDARIVYRNFTGAESKFNRKGERNFAVVIPEEVDFEGKLISGEEMMRILTDNGWNVKIKPARDEDEPPFIYLPVKVKFNERGPKVYLKSGENVNALDEESAGMLDDVDILTVDLDIRPFDWEVNGKTGRTAYLQSIHVVQQIDRFAARYSNEEF